MTVGPDSNGQVLGARAAGDGPGNAESTLGTPVVQHHGASD